MNDIINILAVWNRYQYENLYFCEHFKTYNLTDWVPGGWAHYLEGYTIYYSHPDDEAFSPTNGILVADITRGVPIVSMYEKRTNLMGGRYSKKIFKYLSSKMMCNLYRVWFIINILNSLSLTDPYFVPRIAEKNIFEN